MVSDSLGLVDFAVGLVNSVLNLTDGQVIFLGENSKTRQETRQCFIWSLIQSYVHPLYPNNLKS